MTVARWALTPALIAFLLFIGGIYLAFEAGIFHQSMLVGWGIFLIGGGFLGFASLPVLFLKRAHQAAGIVLAHKKYSSDGYYPIVRYALPNGEEITFQSRSVRTRTSLPVSTNVTVLYDPENPEIAIIDRFLEKGGLLVLIGILLFLIGLPGLVFGMLIGGGLIQIPLSSSIEVGAGSISGSVASSSPLGIGLAVLATLGSLGSVFRVLKEYRKRRRLPGKRKHH